VVEYHPIRAALIGGDQCVAFGLKVRAPAPVLAMCRELIAAGYDPRRPLHAYRGNDVLALKVRSIGEGAECAVGVDSKLGPPIFRRRQDDAQRDVEGSTKIFGLRVNILAL
jgi:hypothetical protein